MKPSSHVGVKSLWSCAVADSYRRCLMVSRYQFDLQHQVPTETTRAELQEVQEVQAAEVVKDLEAAG